MTIAKKSMTLSEIAKLSGVSLPVVSAILGNGKKGSVRYSQKTHDKVMQIVELTNYRPNRTARNLRSNRHGNIGILSRAMGSVHSVILNMMQSIAAKQNQCLIFCEGSEKKVPDFFVEDFVDGIIIIDYVYDGLQKQVADSGLPAIWVNTGVQDAGALDYNEVEAIRLAMKHFAEIGKRHVAFFDSEHNHYSQPLRFETLRRSSEDLGFLPPELFSSSHYVFDKLKHDALAEEIAQFLTAHPTVDAVILSNDVMGAPLYNAARKLGRTIPDDLAVIGFMDSYIATALYPALTSLHTDFFEIGRKAIYTLSELIDGKAGVEPLPLVPYELIVRESTARN